MLYNQTIYIPNCAGLLAYLIADCHINSQLMKCSNADSRGGHEHVTTPPIEFQNVEET